MADSIVTVDAGSVGLRLDLYLVQRFSSAGFTRAEIQRLIDEAQVTVNGRYAKASTRIKLQDLIQLRSLPLRDSALRPENLPLEILYEDSHCMVINKAAGVMVHPAGGKVTGTLVNALLHHCPDLAGIGGERRPGIVHRLDKETSGVMVVAKTPVAFQWLARQFRDRQVQKEYVALVWGRLPSASGVIDSPIGRHRSDRKRMSSRHSLARSREAVTEWQIEKAFQLGAGSSLFQWVSLLRLNPRTGRTHQLRVHLADFGFPIIGDKLYGHRRRGLERNSGANSVLNTFPRQALHAQRLSFFDPANEKLATFRAPLPQDMHDLLRFLEGVQYC
jgi:23S rRNA pseudouridine1911/1915/1917 synthase